MRGRQRSKDGLSMREAVGRTEGAVNSPLVDPGHASPFRGMERRKLVPSRSVGLLDRARNREDRSPTFELGLSPKQRPPSRQRHPFPQHLADFRHGLRRPGGEPQAFSTEASQVENTKEHIKATKKLADRQRPGTRKVSSQASVVHSSEPPLLCNMQLPAS